MKIGIHFFTTGADIGGGFTFGEQIIKAISQCSAAKKHEILIFTPISLSFVQKHEGFQEVIIPQEEATPFPTRVKNFTLRRLGRSVSSPLSALQKKIQEENPDIIYFIDPFYAENVDVPYIVTVWDLQHRLQPFFPEVRILNTWENRERMFSNVLGKAAYIIACNETGKNEVMNFYGIPSERIAMLPHPTPSFALEAGDGDLTVLQKFNLRYQEYLFYPAQFWAHKNHIAILDVIASLRAQGLQMKAVFSGSDKGNKDYIMQTAELMGISDQIVFAGFVDREELIALYRNAFALSYASFFGPENLPPLEAFALGCPVIASDANGVREQLGDAALYFNPKKPEELVNQILALSNVDIRNAMIEKGKIRCQTRRVEDFALGFFDIIDSFSAIKRTWK